MDKSIWYKISIILGSVFFGYIAISLATGAMKTFHIEGVYRLFTIILVQNSIILLALWWYYGRDKAVFRKFGLHLPEKKSAYTVAILVGLVLFMAGNLYMYAFQIVMGRDIEAQDLTAFFPNQATVLDLLLLLVTVGVLAPFTEELLFRGAVYHAYKDSKIGVFGAMIVASFTFALLHADMERFIVFFIGGMVFNVLSRHYNSLAVSMLSHATWNTLSLLAFYRAVGRGGVE